MEKEKSLISEARQEELEALDLSELGPMTEAALLVLRAFAKHFGHDSVTLFFEGDEIRLEFPEKPQPQPEP